MTSPVQGRRPFTLAPLVRDAVTVLVVWTLLMFLAAALGGVPSGWELLILSAVFLVCLTAHVGVRQARRLQRR